MNKYNVIFLKKKNSIAHLPKELFSSLIALDCQILSEVPIRKEKIDALIIEADCIQSAEDKFYLINLEVNENIPVLYFFQEKLKETYVNFRSWKIIQGDYTDREIKLSIEAAIYKIEVDKEIKEHSYQIDSSKWQIEKQAAAMALLAEKLSVLQVNEKRISESKSRFIKQIMFQLSTGMNGVLGFTQLLQLNELKGEQGEAVDEIRFACESLLNQMHNILNMSYYENKDLTFSLSEFNVSLAFNSVVTYFKNEAEKKGLKLVVVEKEIKGYWLGSSEALHLIQFNLLAFILGSSMSPGEIEVRLTHEKHNKSDILACSLKRKVSEINENGKNSILILKNYLAGTPFEMYQKEDSALISTAIVLKALNGSLCQNYEDGVINIEYQIPFVFKKDIELAREGQKVRHVLYVDDNILFRQIGFEILSDMNCIVDSAENGLVAIEKLKSKKYDIILMDCLMPEMDGMEATKRIRLGEAGSINKAIPIVALTASALKDDREKCLEVGMNDFLSKPFQIENIEAMLEKWVSK